MVKLSIADTDVLRIGHKSNAPDVLENYMHVTLRGLKLATYSKLTGLESWFCASLSRKICL